MQQLKSNQKVAIIYLHKVCHMTFDLDHYIIMACNSTMTQLHLLTRKSQTLFREYFMFHYDDISEINNIKRTQKSERGSFLRPPHSTITAPIPLSCLYVNIQHDVKFRAFIVNNRKLKSLDQKVNIQKFIFITYSIN